MSSIAIAEPQQLALPAKPPEGLSPSRMWELVKDQGAKLLEYREEAQSAGSAMGRASSATVDTAVCVGAGFAVPLALEAFPKAKRIGKNGYFVDTQLVLATMTLIGGGAMFVMGVEGGQAVLEAGKGVAASYAGIKATQLGQEWFKPAIAA